MGMSSDIAEKATMPYAMTSLPPCLSARVPPRSCVPALDMHSQLSTLLELGMTANEIIAAQPTCSMSDGGGLCMKNVEQ